MIKGHRIPVHGGCISSCWKVETENGFIFLKENSGFQGQLSDEAHGLELLTRACCLRIPEVLEHCEGEGLSYLALEFVESGSPCLDFWENLGRGLARQHRHSSASFGLERNNWIGSLPQNNDRCNNWPEFFVSCRLEPLLRLTREADLLETDDLRRFEKLFKTVECLFPVEPSALLHGDLWNGNFLCDSQGEPVLFDPAVYFGHREMDLGMTRLFGGFSAGFYACYNEEYPLEAGWEERLDLCNLYPLLVHLQLFGSSYLAQIRKILVRFT